MSIRTFSFMIVMFFFYAGIGHADDLAPTQQLEGFNLNGYTTSGKKSWEINVDKADISDDNIKITNVNERLRLFY